ncbi:sensor histidine kinase [Puniceibacterium confluentis]|uniref:sensor histidine kinase n=1 Tax=Puniceibacterium confluentis TaxID=1958944 RepID=UPI0011B69D8C|nr:HAMP domain-containing sensor histidine kinase [Puniceibacterium confluentis]
MSTQDSPKLPNLVGARRFLSLRARLGLGALLLGLAALATTALIVLGMEQVSARIDAALAAEKRIERYSVLSTQVSTLIVVAAEAIQSGLPAEERAARLDSVTASVTRTFVRLRQDLEEAVEEARALGLDEQSRRATQSIGIARMEALFQSTRNAFLSSAANRERLQGYIDTFAISFDPLLNGVITDEVRARDAILSGIADLRRRLTRIAFGIAAVTLMMMTGYYLGLVRPQFDRLNLLRSAARQIGQEDFAVALPDHQPDEIGLLFTETNRMAVALARRKAKVDHEWARLNATIAERTEALRAANAELSRTDENRRRFFADISHELRTPLTVILMEAQLGLKGAPDAASAFETIHNRALRLNRRIDDLLRIARSETGQLALSATSFDLAGVLRDAADDTRAEVHSAGMTLSQGPLAPVAVIGDPNWIRQVVTGLIQNAVRHARAGGRIELALDSADGMGRIHVSDNGPGIAAEDQEAVFGRFTQGRSPAKAEGFGIGLALAKWVVEQQGGFIALTSPVPPAGTTDTAPGTKVTVGLPLDAA